MKYLFIFLLMMVQVIADDIKLPINKDDISILKIKNDIYEISIISNNFKFKKEFSLKSQKEFNLSNLLIKFEEAQEKIKRDLNDNNIYILNISNGNNTQFFYITLE